MKTTFLFSVPSINIPPVIALSLEIVPLVEIPVSLVLQVDVRLGGLPNPVISSVFMLSVDGTVLVVSE